MRTFRVAGDRDAAAFRHWVRRLPLYEDATREVCCVDIWSGGRRIAEIECADERLAYACECIATYVAILREDGYTTGWGLK